MPRRWWVAPIALYVAAIALLVVAFLLAERQGVPFVRLTADAAIAYTDDAPFYGGYLSSFGMLFWSTAAGICLFTACTLAPSTDARRETRGFLATLGLLTAILLVDDLFMVHEAIYQLTGRSQKRVVLIQGMVLAWMLWRYRATIHRSTNWMLLGSAMGMFAGSLAVDFDAVALPERFHHFFEDGLKLMGLFGWWGYAVSCSAAAVRLPAGEHNLPPLPLIAPQQPERVAYVDVP
jgi:hypothetical protein